MSLRVIFFSGRHPKRRLPHHSGHALRAGRSTLRMQRTVPQNIGDSLGVPLRPFCCSLRPQSRIQVPQSSFVCGRLVLAHRSHERLCWRDVSFIRHLPERQHFHRQYALRPRSCCDGGIVYSFRQANTKSCHFFPAHRVRDTLPQVPSS